MAKKQKQPVHPREMTRHQLSHHKRQQRRQRFIFFGGISVILAVVLIIMLGWLFGDYVPMHKTILQVYDTKFDVGYYIDRVKLAMINQDQSNFSTVVSNIISLITENELEKHFAATQNITVSESDILATLKKYNLTVTQASKDVATGLLLPDLLKSQFFDKTIPVSDNQVYMTGIMCEDQDVANIVRAKLASGDNITDLAKEYAQGYYSQTYQGDYGLHSADFFRSEHIPEVPINYSFGPGITPGTISLPLSDNISYKQLGYWVIRVNARPSDTTANISAILCNSVGLAQDVRAQLEAGADLATLADKYSQYTETGSHGELGIMSSSTNVSSFFNGYVYDPSTPLGQWSEPIRDTYQWTTGGYWVMKIDDVKNNSPIDDADRKTMIDNAYSEWQNSLMSNEASAVHETFSDALKKWANNKAQSALQAGG